MESAFDRINAGHVKQKSARYGKPKEPLTTSFLMFFQHINDCFCREARQADR